VKTSIFLGAANLLFVALNFYIGEPLNVAVGCLNFFAAALSFYTAYLQSETHA
jgi:hypothetical protein